MLIINSWFGRLGNNILQIINAINYAINKKHSVIKFNRHAMLLSNTISIENCKRNDNIIQDNFFYLERLKLNEQEPYIMKQYFQKYIKPIFKVQLEGNNHLDSDNEIYIHFRGGDIFSSNTHNKYVQPPLSYYMNIIKNYDTVKMVCEDKKNPCINELLKKDNVEYTSNTLEKDLSILSTATNLVIGFGTFGFLLYLMNTNLKNLYIPDFFVNILPKGEWGDDITIHIIELPNYIKVGEWKNTEEQKTIMLDY